MPFERVAESGGRLLDAGENGDVPTGYAVKRMAPPVEPEGPFRA